MDIQIEQAITNIIDAMVEVREMFTAFDVTSQLRQQGHQVLHRGQDGVRNFVHSAYTEGGDGVFPACYVKSLHDFGKGPSFVFHPHDADIEDYDSSKWQTVGSPTPTPAPAPVDDGKIGTDGRGRLTIRASLIRQMGLNVGDSVVITKDSDSFIVSSYTNPVANCQILVVDKSNNVRIGPDTLKNVFGRPAKTLRVEMELGSDSVGQFIRVTA